jgi:hypothetical protein
MSAKMVNPNFYFFTPISSNGIMCSLIYLFIYLFSLGNWSSFRNEFNSGSNASICVENFTPIPKRGHLEFDFSGSDRPRPNFDIPISNRKFLSILTDKLQLLDENTLIWAVEFLEDLELGKFFFFYFSLLIYLLSFFIK